ncbi:MAG: hypothetical protein LBE13_06940 [Bacteroidales bacterium]|jgi:hypothetical protein|nr:hypothetical protein [Bacteroidales bacterium]
MSRLFNFYQVFIIAIAVLLVCIASHVNATDSDNFSLTVDKGKPDASPNPAAVNEAVTFRFVVSLYDSQGKRIEEVPTEVKQITYTVNCDVGTITNVVPNMVISTDKHSASKTVRQLYSGVSATAQFPQAGNYSLGLTVTVMFNDNSTPLQKSYSIFINVVDATCTVFANRPPTKILYSALGVPIRHCISTPGHSFWKIEYSAPPGTLTSNETSVVGKPYGHYPKNTLSSGKNVINVVDGKIRDDSSHSYEESASFSITPANAKNALAETFRLCNDNGLKYHLINTFAKNCTGQCVRVSNSFAHANSPTGVGTIGWVDNANDAEGTYDPVPFSNPYHHAEQLKSLNP